MEKTRLPIIGTEQNIMRMILIITMLKELSTKLHWKLLSIQGKTGTRVYKPNSSNIPQ